MVDTFKGIITVDGKKRQLPYESVFGKPIADRTLTIEGAFADAKVVGDKFKEAKAEIDLLKEDIDNRLYLDGNMFDASAVKKDIYYSNSNGTIVEKQNTSYVGYVLHLEDEKKYTLTGADYIIYIAKDGKYKGNVQPSNPVTINTALFEDANEAYISIKIPKYDLSTYMIVDGNTLPSEYIQFGYRVKGGVYAEKKEVKQLEERINDNHGAIYHVGNEYNYKTFTECVKALANDTSKKTIFIHGGVYDLFEELGGADYALSIEAGTPWYECNVIIPPNTTIIGIGYVELNFKPTAEEIGVAASKLLSPINIRGTCTIENLVVMADNCRYGIHDESSGDVAFSGANKKYRNIKCIKQNTGNIGYTQAYAAGIDADQHVIFEGCYFESQNGNPFSIHNRIISKTNAIAHSASIEIDNCAFLNKIADGYGIRLGSSTSEQQNILTRISNSYISHGLLVRNEDEKSTTVKNPYNITMYRCNNKIADIAATNNIYTPTILD